MTVLFILSAQVLVLRCKIILCKSYQVSSLKIQLKTQKIYHRQKAI